MAVNNSLKYENGSPVPTIGGTGERVMATAGATSSQVTLPAGTGAVKVVALGAIYLKFGAGSATAVADATSILHYAGVDAYAVPSGSTVVAVIRAEASDVTVQFEKVG